MCTPLTRAHKHKGTKVHMYVLHTYSYMYLCMYVSCILHTQSIAFYYTKQSAPHVHTHFTCVPTAVPVTVPGTKFYNSNYFCLAANVLHPPHHQKPTTCTLLSASFNLPFHSFLHLFLRTHRCIFLPTMQTSLLIQYHCHPILPLNVRS